MPTVQALVKPLADAAVAAEAVRAPTLGPTTAAAVAAKEAAEAALAEETAKVTARDTAIAAFKEAYEAEGADMESIAETAEALFAFLTPPNAEE